MIRSQLGGRWCHSGIPWRSQLHVNAISTMARWLLFQEKGTIRSRLREEGRKEAFIEPSTQEGLCLQPKRWHGCHQSLRSGSHPKRWAPSALEGLWGLHPWSYGGSPLLKQPPLSARESLCLLFFSKIVLAGLSWMFWRVVPEGSQDILSHLSRPESWGHTLENSHSTPTSPVWSHHNRS